MPVKFPCTKCKKACKKVVGEGEESICCDKCEKWVHFRCTGLNEEQLEQLGSTSIPYICDRCLNTCLICSKLCRINQKLIRCLACKHAVHAKCRLPTYGTFFHDAGSEEQFFCSPCIEDAPALSNNTPKKLLTLQVYMKILLLMTTSARWL